MVRTGARLGVSKKVKKKRDDRKRKGLCPRCGGEKLGDKINCEKCLEKNRKNTWRKK